MLRRSVVPLCFLIFGIFHFCLGILGIDLSFIPGDLGDSRFINYLLEHGYLFLKGEVNFWDAPFMYPYKNVTALSDNMLGTMPIYALLRFFHFSMETSYQLWWIIICTLNFICAFIVLRKFTDHIVLSAALAYVFAFGFFNLNHINYMQMIIRFNVPIVVYCAYKLIESPHRKYLSGYVFFLVFQFYCVIYTGLFLFYSTLLFMVLYAYFTKRKSSIRSYFQKGNRLNTWLTFAAAIVLMGLLLYPYVVTAFNLGFRSYEGTVANLPTISSYFYSAKASYLWRFLSDENMVPHKNHWLQSIFAGVVPVLCFIIPIIYLIYQKIKNKPLDHLVLSAVITCVVFFMLFTRTERGLTFYNLVFQLPGMNIIRVPTRFVHVQIFFILLMGAVVFVKQKTWLVYGLVLLCIVDNLFDPAQISRTTKTEIQQRKNLLAEKIESYDYKKYKAVAYLTDTIPFFMVHLDAMAAAQSLNIPSVNGYSSACPGDFGFMFDGCDEAGLEHWLKATGTRKDDILVIK